MQSKNALALAVVLFVATSVSALELGALQLSEAGELDIPVEEDISILANLQEGADLNAKASELLESSGGSAAAGAASSDSESSSDKVTIHEDKVSEINENQESSYGYGSILKNDQIKGGLNEGLNGESKVDVQQYADQFSSSLSKKESSETDKTIESNGQTKGDAEAQGNGGLLGALNLSLE